MYGFIVPQDLQNFKHFFMQKARSPEAPPGGLVTYFNFLRIRHF